MPQHGAPPRHKAVPWAISRLSSVVKDVRTTSGISALQAKQTQTVAGRGQYAAQSLRLARARGAWVQPCPLHVERDSLGKSPP